MAIFSKIKPWETETPGENLFLYLYNLAKEDVKIEISNQSWVNSNHILTELFHLITAIDLTYRSFNLGVNCSPNLTIENISHNLKQVLGFNPGRRNTSELSELVRLACLAFQNQKLTIGMKNTVHRESSPQCCWCGRRTHRTNFSSKNEKSTIEHLWPEFLGGTSNLGNLTISCGDCNSRRKHAISWAWFGVQSYFEKIDGNNSIPKEIRLAVAFHRLIKVASGQTRLSKNAITLKEASVRLQGIIPNMPLKVDQRYTFLDFLNLASE